MKALLLTLSLLITTTVFSGDFSKEHSCISQCSYTGSNLTDRDEFCCAACKLESIKQ
jgi:hypothetical protein